MRKLAAAIVSLTLWLLIAIMIYGAYLVLKYWGM